MNIRKHSITYNVNMCIYIYILETHVPAKGSTAIELELRRSSLCQWQEQEMEKNMDVSFESS